MRARISGLMAARVLHLLRLAVHGRPLHGLGCAAAGHRHRVLAVLRAALAALPANLLRDAVAALLLLLLAAHDGGRWLGRAALRRANSNAPGRLLLLLARLRRKGHSGRNLMCLPYAGPQVLATLLLLLLHVLAAHGGSN